MAKKLSLTRCLIWCVLILALLYALLRPFKEHFIEGFEDEQSCSSCTGEDDKGGENKLLPVFDPLFNAREWCKDCILLEDHLVNTRKFCLDCCRKHLLKMEALAEEACGLDKKGEHIELLGPLADKCRNALKKLSKERRHEIAQEMRAIRKDLVPKCWDKY